MEWYYANESDQQISFQEENFQRLVNEGAIQSQTLVWNEGMTDWKPCGQVKPGLFGSVTPAAHSPAAASPVASASQYTTAGPAAQTGGVQQPIGPVTTGAPADGLAITSLVCGILGFLCYPLGFVLGLVAVICGHISRKNLLAKTGSKANGGMALAGIILGYIAIVIGTLMMVYFIVVGVMAENGQL